MPDKFWIWLAWRLPYKLRLWATMKSCADATTGQWSNTDVTRLTMMDMLKRIERTD